MNSEQTQYSTALDSTLFRPICLFPAHIVQRRFLTDKIVKTASPCSLNQSTDVYSKSHLKLNDFHTG